MSDSRNRGSLTDVETVENRDNLWELRSGRVFQSWVNSESATSATIATDRMEISHPRLDTDMSTTGLRTGTRMSLDEFLALDETDGKWELDDGVLYIMASGTR